VVKKKKVRVILIDPEKKTITEMMLEPYFQRYYFWMGCSMIEQVLRQVNESEVNTLKQNSSPYIRMYVDETGGYTDKQKFILRTKYGSEELIGKSLLIGDHNADGEETDCLWSLDDVRKFIFFDISSLRRFVHDKDG
jgi:hypothetical protein